MTAKLYLLLTLLFISLTAAIFIFYQKYSQQYSTDLVLQNTNYLPTSVPLPTYPVVSSTPAPTVTPISSPTPTPLTLTYQNTTDNFQVIYKSNRQESDEVESTGSRHVFYNSSGNITVHAGTGWSWEHPGRTFTATLLVDGQNTFVYTAATQKIVDFQKNNLDYTIQCVHNGTKSLIAECDQFITSFKFLK